MRKERVLGLSIISLFVISFLVSFVSAETNIESVAGSLADGLEKISINPTYLTEALLGILLFMILYTIVVQLFNFSGKKGGMLAGITSLIIVILTFVWLPSGYVEAIALQYSAMGATILTVIPFAIMLYFTLVINKSLLFARITWLFYAMYYLTMFIYKLGVSETGKIWTWDNIPYFGALIIGIIIFFFIKDIRNLIFKEKLTSNMTKAKENVALRAAGREIETAEAVSRGL